MNKNQNIHLTLDELADAALNRSDAECLRNAPFPLREFCPDIARIMKDQVRIPPPERRALVPILENQLSRSVDVGEDSDFFNAFLDVIEKDPAKIFPMMLVLTKVEGGLPNRSKSKSFTKIAPVKTAKKSTTIVKKKLKTSENLSIEEFSEMELISLLFNYGLIQGIKIYSEMSEDEFKQSLSEFISEDMHSKSTVAKTNASKRNATPIGKKKIAATTGKKGKYLVWKKNLNTHECERIEEIRFKIESILNVSKSSPNALLVNPDILDEFEEKVQNLGSLIEKNEIKKTNIKSLDKDTNSAMTCGDYEIAQNKLNEIIKIKKEIDIINIELNKNIAELKKFLKLNSNFFEMEQMNKNFTEKPKQEGNRKREKGKDRVKVKPLNIEAKSSSKSKGKSTKLVKHQTDEESKVASLKPVNSENSTQTPPIFDIDKPMIQRILIDLIDDRKFAIACRFAQALQYNDYKSILNWTCLELEACSRISFESVDSSTQDFFEKVSLAELNSRNKDHESAIVFGALLRPAILQPSYIRAVIGRLNLKLYKEQVGELVQMINSLDHHSYHPTLDFLASCSGKLGVSRVDRVKQKLVDWIVSTNKRNAPCTRSTGIIHSLTKSNGEFHKVVMEIENEGSNAKKLASRLLKKYETHGNIRQNIKDIENSRLNGEEMLPTSIDYLHRKVEEGRNLVSQWLDAQTESGKESIGDELNTEEITQELITLAEKAVDKLKSSSDSKDNVRTAISNWLAYKIGELIDLLNGNSIRTKNSMESAISDELDLITVKKPIQPRTFFANNEDAEEKNKQDDIEIVEFLKNYPVPSVEAAIEVHCKNGAFRRAIRLLDLVEDMNRQKELGEFVNESRLNDIFMIEENISEMISILHDIGNIDISNSEYIYSDIDYLNSILEVLNYEKTLGIEEIAHSLSTNIPSDINIIKEHLHALKGKISGTLEKIRSNQRRKLEKLIHENPERTDEIRRLLDSLEDHKLAYVEDEIANIRQKRSFVRYSGTIESHFEKFYGKFISEAFNDSWSNDKNYYLNVLNTIDHLKFDSNRFEESRKLLDKWFDFKNAFKSNAEYSSDLEILLKMLSFQNVKLKEISGDNFIFHKFNLSVPAGIDWFLPPIFGSLSNNCYNILIVNGSTLADQLMNDIDAESPTIVIFTNRLSIELRSDIAFESHKKGVPILLVDELLIAFIAFNSGSRMEVLFDCGLPFGCVKPYTTDPSKIPREMFFGRNQEIRKIAGRQADGILVYGGRQLGKSTLLEQVVDIHYGNEFLVFRDDIKMLGSFTNADDIWTIIAEKFQEFTNTKDKVDLIDTNKLGSTIKQWIKDKPSRRILCLFDEADNFFASELKNGFPNVIRMISLMEDTSRSFKVVFAGLHQVQRMHMFPNSPLAHLGTPICVGPLNTTDEDLEAAYRLVVLPLRAKGFKFDNENVPKQILSYVNFYPSLIQVFMKQLTEYYQIPEDEKGPLWEIPRSEVFEGKGFLKFEAEVRVKFGYTLDLDQRYKLIANVLGHLKNQGMVQEVMYDGLPIDRIHTEIEVFWPKRLEPMSNSEFRNILEEMVGLGILNKSAKQHSESMYCLKSNQVANMLGSKQNIEDSILSIEDYEPPLEFDPTTHKRLLGKIDDLRKVTDADKFSPLTDHQLNQLLYNESSIGVKFVLGIKEFGLPKVVESIRKLSKSPSLNPGNFEIEILLPKNVRDFGNAIRFEPEKNTTTLVIFEPNEDEIENILKFSDILSSVKSSKMRPILILDATRKKFRGVAINRKSDTVILKPWGHTMLRTYLETIEKEVVQKNVRSVILENTGGIPSEVTRMIVENQAIGRQSLEQFEVSCKDKLLKLDREILITTKFLVEITNDFRSDNGISEEELFMFCNEIIQNKLKIDLYTIGLDLKVLGILDEFSPSKMHLEISYFGKLICKLVQSVQESHEYLDIHYLD